MRELIDELSSGKKERTMKGRMDEVATSGHASGLNWP